MIRFCACLALAAAPRAQVDLVPELADSGTAIVGVLNKDPADGRYLGYCEGPAVDAGGNLFFTEKGDESGDRTGPNIIWKVTPQGAASRFYSSHEGTNGLEFDPQGRLVAMQSNKVRRFAKDGKSEILDSSYLYRSLNDLSIGSNGDMYMTNLGGGSVFRLSADGKKRQAFDFYGPNGVEWIEEKGIVYVNGGGGVQRLTVAGDGSLAGPVMLKRVGAPDGITVDERGNIYVASWEDGAVYVIDSTGKDLGAITVTSADTADLDPSNNVSNCAFGGPGNKTLYITGGGGAYSVRLKVAGRKRPTGAGIAGPLRAPAAKFTAVYSHAGLRVVNALPSTLRVAVRDITGASAAEFPAGEGTQVLPLKLHPGLYFLEWSAPGISGSLKLSAP